MKKIIGDNFCNDEKYKLYRTVYEIIHPTISKKNISNYKIVLDEKILPVLVFYPKKVSGINSAIIYVPGDGNVSGSYGEYSNICKRMAKESNTLVIAVDYFNGNVKYPTIGNKVYRTINYLIEELVNNGISDEKITLIGDSTGCNVLGHVIFRMINKKKKIHKMVMIYPITRTDYSNYLWDEVCKGLNFNLDKRINDYLKRYYPKDKEIKHNLYELVYYKEFPSTLIVTGDMDIFKSDGEELFNRIMNNDDSSKYCNIKFASHGFLSCEDEEILKETYKVISDFVIQ